MKKLFSAIVFVATVFSPLISLAQNPAVASFTVSPASGPSGYPFAFVWSLENAFGSSFLIPCIQGIKLKYLNDSALACGTRITSQVATNNGLGVKVINISGNQVSVAARVIPKDSSGKDYDAGGQTLYISVGVNQQPIEKFTTSTTTTVSGDPVTISWSSTDLDNVNLSIECKPEIKVLSQSYTAGLYLPCGKPIFQPDLAKSGSLKLNFTNSSVDPLPFTLTLIPAMAPGVYNAIYPSTLILTIASDIVPDPVVNYFTTSVSAPAYPGQVLPISWSTQNTKGVNLKISCADGITATSSKNPSLALPCGNYAFADNDLLPPSGDLNLSFQNSGSLLNVVSINLTPAFKAKTGYDATKNRTLSVEVRPKNSARASVAAPKVPQLLPPNVPKSVVPQSSQNQSAQPQTAPAPRPKVDAPHAYIPPTDAKTTIKKEFQIVEYVRLKFLFLIPVDVKVTTTKDEGGNIKNVKYPWWSYLGFLR
ncbi:MAG: hypothetical protein UW81_C0006G0001 [Candidatus Giovannonibacteria bacterium GW2011_GWC2_44_9]|uniref:Uncharacterized protein n=3 Tax=Candidatus Giovannoniibacteriota TaxID=1752738 RepID=A0A0G1IXX2_9BACT|nr:MAG: hypothetical protein UW49_C0004G0046 [Candidatus Giovannonibacteria bacterium GW2011_GWB1_44_23]KKT63935.1 MAG: hypothetical protein UW57_C0004G0045 [Candidatus Giovannonibacteria bacterium GW2011_GWA1_44_29]KKT84076.1 MAG: hypothetical protein UW81_C0006G0001 [Candidatus Giovannonibacteria bacterium GW2011_GWC2_44_9]KKT91648.1 MAG: hypothetical protein UW93_C0004G0046 [Parcubacteria group bacterium GW2011_GWC1_45_13]